MVYHSKYIANAFQKYYFNLYNLNTDSATPQPTENYISDFLASVKPVLEFDLLNSLKLPISDEEILTGDEIPGK